MNGFRLMEKEKIFKRKDYKNTVNKPAQNGLHYILSCNQYMCCINMLYEYIVQPMNTFLNLRITF